MKMRLRVRYSKTPVLDAAASGAAWAAHRESTPCEEEQRMPLPGLSEYAYYVKLGKPMAVAMKAAAYAHGGAHRPFRLCSFSNRASRMLPLCSAGASAARFSRLYSAETKENARVEKG